MRYRLAICTSFSIDISMTKESIWNVYDRYGQFYDFTFGRILDPGRKKAVNLMNVKSNQKIIEFGIGTGLSFKHYPKSIKIEMTGIDLSKKMLNKAQIRSRKFQNLNITLKNLDGENTHFEDASFDKVVLMYVYSVTANPEKIITEALRICKDDGSIYIVNHFSQSNGRNLSVFEKIISSSTTKIGFRSDFSYKKYIEHLDLKIESIESANIFALTKVIHLKKDKNTHLLKAN